MCHSCRCFQNPHNILCRLQSIVIVNEQRPSADCRFQQLCCVCLLLCRGCLDFTETDRIRFLGARFRTPHPVNVLALGELWGENSVSSFRPLAYVPERSQRVCEELTQFVTELTKFSVFSKLSSSRNARLSTALFVRNFGRVCSQFWLSVRNFL